MNKTVKKMMKENEKLEKDMNPGDEESFIDIIAYLRGSRISTYNQEVIRKDIIEMIVEGESRGATMEEIIGEDYKVFCDEIIKEFPPRTKEENLIDSLEIILMCTSILGLISIVFNIANNLGTKESIFHYTLSLGDIVSYVLIIWFANFIVNKICKGAFNPPKINNKVLEFFALWATMGVIFAGLFGIRYLLRNIAFSFNIIIAVVICAGVFLVYKRIENREVGCEIKKKIEE